MRHFNFQELAYAIVVAAAYGLIIGIYVTDVTDVFDLVIIEALPIYIILWVLFICMHLAGIYLLVKLEEQEQKRKSIASSKNKQE